MSLIDQIIDDIAEITSGDASIEIQLISPTGLQVYTTGFHAKHHLGINPENGAPMHSKKACISFAEKNCSVSIRIKEEVNLKNWRVRCKDSTGDIKKYKCEQWFPDETVGLITVLLSVCDD